MLEVDELHCGYGLLRAVQGASFRVEAGRITALLGPNGAGKSSTVMAIAGHVPVSAGAIRLAGESIAAASPVERTRRGIGLVPEGRRVFSDLNVAENLLVGGYVHGREAAHAREARVLALFPRLAERYRQRAGTLSGGEQQMLAIGRALMADPKVLLIDELSLGLMPAVVDQCFAAILDLVREGVAVLLVEQNTQRALEHADAVVVLVSGHAVYRANGEEARRDARLVDSYLGLREAGERRPAATP